MPFVVGGAVPGTGRELGDGGLQRMLSIFHVEKQAGGEMAIL